MKYFTLLVLTFSAIGCSDNNFHKAPSYESMQNEYLAKTKPTQSVGNFSSGLCSDGLLDDYDKVEKRCKKTVSKKAARTCLDEINSFIEKYEGFHCYLVRDGEWILEDQERIEEAKAFYESILSK